MIRALVLIFCSGYRGNPGTELGCRHLDCISTELGEMSPTPSTWHQKPMKTYPRKPISNSQEWVEVQIGQDAKAAHHQYNKNDKYSSTVCPSSKIRRKGEADEMRDFHSLSFRQMRNTSSLRDAILRGTSSIF